MSYIEIIKDPKRNKELFRQIPIELIGKPKNQPRDFKEINNCLLRVSKIIGKKPFPKNFQLQPIITDLRKLLHDKTAEELGGALFKRNFKNLMLPKIPTIDTAMSKALNSLGFKELVNSPRGDYKEPLPAKLGHLLNLDDWLEQRIDSINGRPSSIKEIITTYANIDACHTDTTDRIDKTKKYQKTIIENKEMVYRNIYDTAEFLFIWLGHYDKLCDLFPILKQLENDLIYSEFRRGFIPNVTPKRPPPPPIILV